MAEDCPSGARHPTLSRALAPSPVPRWWEVTKGTGHDFKLPFYAPRWPEFRFLEATGCLGVSSKLPPHKHNGPRREGTIPLLMRCDFQTPFKSPWPREPAQRCVHITCVHRILSGNWLHNGGTWKTRECGHTRPEGLGPTRDRLQPSLSPHPAFPGGRRWCSTWEPQWARVGGCQGTGGEVYFLCHVGSF